MTILYDYLLTELTEIMNKSAKNGVIKIVATVTTFKSHDDFIIPYYIQWEIHKVCGKEFYIEERFEKRSAHILNGKVIYESIQDERSLISKCTDGNNLNLISLERLPKKNNYERQKAWQYAEIWWNKYNKKYPHFTNDCTNFISQCLYAGGFPMHNTKLKTSGWWYANHKWSYSWSVAHALQLYLSSSPYTQVMEKAEDLTYGDIIFYDFEGNGRFDHSTIVTGKDSGDAPLVNAHTVNSRQRYWNYTDSSAYTENIKYLFFHILDN